MTDNNFLLIYTFNNDEKKKGIKSEETEKKQTSSWAVPSQPNGRYQTHNSLATEK